MTHISTVLRNTQRGKLWLAEKVAPDLSLAGGHRIEIQDLHPSLKPSIPFRYDLFLLICKSKYAS